MKYLQIGRLQIARRNVRKYYSLVCECSAGRNGNCKNLKVRQKIRAAQLQNFRHVIAWLVRNLSCTVNSKER